MGEGASSRDDDRGTSATRLAVRPDDAADLQVYRLVVEHAPLGIVHFDARGVLTACNEHLVALVGKPRESLIGLEMERISDPRIAACVRETLAGRRAHFEGDYRWTTAAKVAPFRMSFAPILAADRSVMGGVVIVEDITERRSAVRAAARSAAAFPVLTVAA
ncbi:MAG: PAS domain-containing protein, partial [Sorangiineae bacterium]|nr:PAS domain-containing protein [Sorangiineae bacterium]